MLQESRSESGTRLARDMRRIREARHLTVHDLHEETKIPLGLIEAFEDSALFDHPQFNRVYLRSFARTYAQVVGIEAELALQALEEALAGTYAGLLAIEYLGEKQQPPPAASVEDVAEASPAETAEAEEQKRQRDRGPAKRPQKKKAETPPKEEPRIPTLLSTTGETAAGYEKLNEPEVADEDWTSQSPPPGVHTDVHPRRDVSTSSSRRGWLYGAGAVILLALLIWVLISMPRDDDAESLRAAADTATTEEPVAAAPSRSRPMPTLGDTLNVHLVASRDKLDPIRVTVDDDLRRPYWLEVGDSMLFKPVNRIVFEEKLDDIAVKIEGVDYPNNRRDEGGRLVITRDSILQYFATAPEQVLEQLADTAAQDAAAQPAQ